jgi:hypothetical protein
MRRAANVAALTCALALTGAGVGAADAAAATTVQPTVQGLSVLRDGPTTAAQSTNWAGYVATGSTFTRITGTWVQPAVSCKLFQSTYSADWVGLDGYSSKTVEQLGSEAQCGLFENTTYYAWTELYPAGEVELPASGYPISPGDTLTATVLSNSTTSYVFSMTDSGSAHHWSYSTPLTTTTADSLDSAEWIAEAPETCGLLGCSISSLANFGTVGFSGASATAGGTAAPISAYPDTQLTMINSSKVVRATTSALSPDGGAFSVTWSHS